MTEAEVDVCICTYRRDSLRTALERLARQQDAPRFSVIVADNDDTPSAKPIVDRAAAELGLAIRYVHAPARNISIARNACLDAATAELIAFLDDDELASSQWLRALKRRLEEQDLDVVFGPVLARYPEGAPDWAIRGDFHSVRPAFRADGGIDTGYSGNVLFRRAVLAGEKFDLNMGRTGGEDTIFFGRLHARGARLGYCAEAEVEEPTPLHRARFGWLFARSFRYGQTFGRLLRERGRFPPLMAAAAAAKTAYCVAAAGLTVWSPVQVRRNLLRGALHAGVLANAFGAADLELYRAPT